MKTPEINGIRVSYNDKFVLKLVNEDIREKKEISCSKKIGNESKEKLDRLLRIKPKEYKNINKKRKRRNKKTI